MDKENDMDCEVVLINESSLAVIEFNCRLEKTSLKNAVVFAVKMFKPRPSDSDLKNVDNLDDRECIENPCDTSLAKPDTLDNTSLKSNEVKACLRLSKILCAKSFTPKNWDVCLKKEDSSEMIAFILNEPVNVLMNDESFTPIEEKDKDWDNDLKRVCILPT